MANLNKKQGQGKTPQQYRDSSRFAWYGAVGMIIVLILTSLLMGCTTAYKTHQIIYEESIIYDDTKKCCDKEYVITEWDGDRQINWYTCKNKGHEFKRTNKTTIRRRTKK